MFDKEKLNKKLELNDEVLKNVSGGGRRERKIVVVVYLPSNMLEPYKMSVYEDGLYQSNMSGQIDPNVQLINLEFSGSGGFSMINVKLNDVLYKSFQLDFDSGSYREL